MYCKNCGYVLSEKIPVCPVCGARIVYENVEQISNASSGAGSASAGTETASAASGVGKTAAVGAGKAAATAVGKGIAAKIGITIAAIVVAGGGFAGVAHYVSRKNSDNDAVKTATVAETGADDETVATEAPADDTAVVTETVTDDASASTETATDDANGENSAATEENQTEAVVSEQDERYAAYYEVTKAYMEKYGTDFEYADLVDFSKSGNEQLVLGYMVEEEKEYEGYTYTSEFYYMTVYDYKDGKSKQILNERTTCLQYGGGSVDADLEYVDNGEGVGLYSCVNETDYEAGGDWNITDTLYEYEDGAMNAVRTCSLTGSAQNGGGIYTVDGQITDEAGQKAAVDEMTNGKNTYKLAVYAQGPLPKDDFICITRSTIKKHDTINTLAKAAGDSEFLNMEDKLQQPTDGQMVYNKYNEEYPYELVEGVSLGSYVVEYSKDGDAFRVRSTNDNLGDDYCMIYENGVFRLVGMLVKSYNSGSVTSSARWYADYDFTQDNESLMNNRDTCSITSEEYEQKVQELMSDGNASTAGADDEANAVAAYKKLMTDALANGYMEWDDMRNGEPNCALVDGTGSADRDSFAIADIDDDGIPELMFKREEACVANLMQLVYRYNPSLDEVEQYFTLSVNTTFYENGYIREDSMHSQGIDGCVVWPHTWGTVKDGEFVYLYGIGGWDGNMFETDYSGNPFPSEYDTDKNGYIYYVRDKATDEETVMDDAEYNEFVDSLELGDVRDLEYQSFTSANISSL